VKATGPRPVLGPVYETPLYRVVVHVVDLFAALVWGVDVEVVVAGLPEGTLSGLDRDREFECLESLREESLLRFAEEKVDVLRYDDVGGDDEVLTEANLLEGLLEEVSC